MTKKLLRSPYDIRGQPHNRRRYEEEKEILIKYGLNTKRQYYISVALAQRYRAFFRRTPRENPTYGQVMKKLFNLGIISSDSKLDVNTLTKESFLDRRLTTLVSKKYDLPIKLARQKIVQKKVKVNGVLKTHCSYLVRLENENKIELNEYSKRKRKSKLATV